jgi:hypothetical protein
VGIGIRKPAASTSLGRGTCVSWNSEASQVTGKIIKVRLDEFDFKGHQHRASQEILRYEIKSEKTDHIAAHKEGALTKIK